MPKMDKSKGQDSSKEIRLIELIRENPELYDTGHPLAKDNNQKRIIWEYISEEMNAPVDTLKKLWKKLRYNYAKKSRYSEADKMTKSTPCDEALAFLMTSVMEYAKENNRGNNSVSISPRGVEETTEQRSSSLLTAISEEERSTSTLVPEEAVDPGDSGPPGPGTPPRENSRFSATSDRVLRPRHSEPSRLASRESLRVEVGARRLTVTPTTPGTRSRNRKLILDPSDSTRVFFDSMAITVSSFPQYLQAIVKLEICKIVAEKECELSSPKNR